jgi:toxin ParE1/3/4
MILRRPRLLEALIENATFIGQDSPAAAERFLEAAEATFQQLEETPELGRLYETDNPRLAGVRVIRVRGFRNHLIFYRPCVEGVELLHLLHGARDLPAVLETDL